MILLSLWFYYMSSTSSWHVYKDAWFMMIVMAFGSFIAGASPEGGGAIAFPAMTLIWDIQPAIARNFSLAIQSIGMTAAAYLIFVRKIPIERKYLFLGLVGGTVGIIFGSYFIIQHIQPAYAKMSFVTIWLSFGVILLYTNIVKKRDTVTELPDLNNSEKIAILVVSFLGGIASSIFGNGLDICTFAYITLRYNLSEKIATPTSVILMASNAVVGFLLHKYLLNDFGIAEHNYWLVCIPVVCFGAPLGAYFISSKSRNLIALLLYAIIAIQFLGALLIVQPKGLLLFTSVIIFVVGLFLFYVLSKVTQHK